MLKLVLNPARQEQVANPVFSGAGFTGFEDGRMNAMRDVGLVMFELQVKGYWFMVIGDNLLTTNY
jgi:hypothetical protein